jgi:hypothetical protein
MLMLESVVGFEVNATRQNDGRRPNTRCRLAVDPLKLIDGTNAPGMTV